MVELVGHVGVAAHQAVHILANLRVVVLHVVVEHRNDDVGRPAALELSCQVVDAFDGVREGQAGRRSRTELVGNVLSDRADESYLHARRRRPQLVVPEVGRAVPVGAHALDVSPQVREGGLHELARVGAVDALFEDGLPHIQLVVADCRSQRVHRVEGRDGRVVLQRAGDVGGRADIVAQQSERGIGVRRACLLQVAVHRGQPGLAHDALFDDLLDVSVHVREGVEVQGDRRGLVL